MILLKNCVRYTSMYLVMEIRSLQASVGAKDFFLGLRFACCCGRRIHYTNHEPFLSLLTFFLIIFCALLCQLTPTINSVGLAPPGYHLFHVLNRRRCDRYSKDRSELATEVVQFIDSQFLRFQTRRHDKRRIVRKTF